MTQENPGFCGTSSQPQKGFCDGDHQPNPDYPKLTDDKKWFFTINRQVYPSDTIDVTDGQIWRITSASGSVSYSLSLVNTSPALPATTRMFFQIVSIDDVAPDLSNTQPNNWVSCSVARSIRCLAQV